MAIRSDEMIDENNFSAGLADAEIDELADFLLRRCSANGGMPISMLDGYVTAIASSPEFAVPSEWLPLVLGADTDADTGGLTGSGDGATLKSMAEAERVTGLILRRLGEIERDLEAGTLTPIFIDESDDEGTELVTAAVWCLGYLRGVTLQGDVGNHC